MPEEVNRRSFLKTAALAAGPAVISARGANDKINIGWIGVGTRGNAALDWLHTAAPDDVQITAICDTHQGYIARALDRMQTIWGNKPATYVDYTQLLADKSIDAVYIMTPEHLHHDMTIAALKAGQARLHRKAAGPYHRRGLRHRKHVERGQPEAQDHLPGGHPEPQLVAVQESQGNGAAGHDRGRALCPRFLVSQRASRPAVVALRDPAGRQSGEHGLEPVPRPGAEASLGSAPLLPVAPLLGLLRRHLDRPAGAPDRHRQFHARQDRAAHLHRPRAASTAGPAPATTATCPIA